MAGDATQKCAGGNRMIRILYRDETGKIANLQVEELAKALKDPASLL